MVMSIREKQSLWEGGGNCGYTDAEMRSQQTEVV